VVRGWVEDEEAWALEEDGVGHVIEGCVCSCLLVHGADLDFVWACIACVLRGRDGDWGDDANGIDDVEGGGIGHVLDGGNGGGDLDEVDKHAVGRAEDADHVLVEDGHEGGVVGRVDEGEEFLDGFC